MRPTAKYDASYLPLVILIFYQSEISSYFQIVENVENIVTIIRYLWMKLDETNIEGLFKCDPVSQIDKGKKENIQSVKIGNNVICIRFLFSVKDRPSRKHRTTW